MKIKQIELSNWRAYESAIFKFDISDVEKNCVLIKAPNGFGKTSFFEAITLCIYGEKGIPLLARASEAKKPRILYNQLLSNVIHKKALDSREYKVSVKIAFENEDEKTIEVSRDWYFSPSGDHKAGEEQFIILIDGQPQAPENGENKEEWEAELISKYFVNHSLANFFLFDGEMVRDLAKMDQAAQVKTGIEGLMGVPILRELISSLDSYKKEQKKTIKSTETGVDPVELVAKIEKLDLTVKKLDEEIKNLENEILVLETEQKNLFAQNSLLDLPTIELSKLYENLKDAESERDDIKHKLEKKIVSDFSLGLVGKDLINKAINLLEADQILDEWEVSKNQGERGKDNFINDIKERLDQPENPVPAEFHSAVIDLVSLAWWSIWHPKPENCPEKSAFPYLSSTVREQIRNKFTALHQSGLGIENSFLEINKLEDKGREINRDIKKVDSIGPSHKKISDRLSEISSELTKKNTMKGAKNNERDAVAVENRNENNVLNQIIKSHNDAKPVVELINKANHIAKVVRKIMEEIIPLQSEELASKMSKIYLELSNKSVVKEVKIDNDFDVKLIGSNNQPLEKTGMSAGEEQIFSQALISAVVQVSNFDFPMIIDTPLARLDKRHRNSILNHFKNSKRQIIFLSTDTEIVGEYYNLLEKHISDVYTLNHTNTDGIGYTSVEKKDG